MNIYLGLNALLYILLAGWCIAMPEKTANAIGYQLLGGSGRSEYLVVYGGLQIGLALIFVLCLSRPEWRYLGILFAVCLYLPINICRMFSFYKFSEIGAITVWTAALEVVLLVWAVYLALSLKPE